MSSNDNITEILSRFSSSASQLADLIGRSSSDNGVSRKCKELSKFSSVGHEAGQRRLPFVSFESWYFKWLLN